MTGLAESTHRALLVGVGGYEKDRGFQPLRGPALDVELLDRVLAGPGGLYAVTRVYDPDAGLEDRIAEFLEAASPADEILVYFSGHGEIDDDGALRVAHINSVKNRLKSSAVAFVDLWGYALRSRARSVVFVLDCCKAGEAETYPGGSVGAAVEDAANSISNSDSVAAHTATRRVRAVLAAVSGLASTPDAERPGEASPFTKELLDALAEAVPEGDGTVTLGAALDVLRAMATSRGVSKSRLPTLVGPTEARDIRVTFREGFQEARLASFGLVTWDLRRTGAATTGGHDVRIVTPLELEVAGRLRDIYPTSVLISDAPGRGKTWLLCAVAEALREDEWEVLAYRPARQPPDPDRLLAELRQLLASRRTEESDRRLVVIDGIEWTEEWATFVEAIGEREFSTAGSIIIAVESSRLTRWSQRLGFVRSAPAVPSRIEQLCRAILKLEVFAAFRPATEGAIEGAVVRLRRAAGLDLWAAAHFAQATLTGDDVTERQLATSWQEHLGQPSPEATHSLRMIAALSSFGLATPVSFVGDSVEFWNRLGVETGQGGTTVRIVSPFVQRALITGGKRLTNPDQVLIDREVTEYAMTYLTTLLPQPQRQKLVRAAVRQLRARPASLDRTVRYLTSPVAGGHKSTVDLWEESRPPLADYVDILATIRALLPPGVTRRLVRGLARRLEADEADSLDLPDLVACLELLDRYRGGNDGAEQAPTREMLVEQILDRLRARTWPAPARSRLVRVLFRFDAETFTSLKELACLVALAPGSPTKADLEVLISILTHIRHRDAHTVSDIRNALVSSAAVEQLLVLTPDAEAEPIDLLITRICVDRMLGTCRFLDAASELRRRLAAAPIGGRARAVQQLSRTAPDLAADVVAWTTALAHQLRRQYLSASPSDLADWLNAARRFAPESIARTLRQGQRADADLVQLMADSLRKASDPVGAGRLLEAAAAIEDQAELRLEGFAEALGSELSTPFLRDQMSDNRVTILAHLIRAYAASSTIIGDEVLATAVDLIVSYINSSSGDFGPRLALALLDSEAVDHAFLRQIRTRVRRSMILTRMRWAYEPSAVAAYHRLGLLLFPGIERDFRDKLEELDAGSDEWFLKSLPERTDPVQVLQAGLSYSDTLLASGEGAAGEQMIRAFDLHLSGGWHRWVPTRLYRARDGDLAECLALLRRMAPNSIRDDMHHEIGGLTRVLLRNEDVPGLFLSVLAAAARCNSEVGTELVDRCQDRGALEVVRNSLMHEPDQFAQVNGVNLAVHISKLTSRAVIAFDDLSGLVDGWLQSPRLPTNPRVLLSMLRVADALGSSWVARFQTCVDIAPLRRRLARRSLAEASSTVMFISELSDVSPALAAEVLPARVASWYLRHCHYPALPALIEMVLGCHRQEVEVQSIVLDRFAMSEQRLAGVSRLNFWRTLGTVSWQMQYHGLPFDLPRPPAALEPRGLPAAEAVWAVGWLGNRDWTTEVLQAASPPDQWDEEEITPWRAGAWIAVALHRELDTANIPGILWRAAEKAPRPVLDAMLAASAASASSETEHLLEAADIISTQFAGWRTRDRRARDHLAAVADRAATRTEYKRSAERS